MKITKFGQCCLLIEVAGKRILTDPGRFSTTQDTVTDLDLILVTHEHADHLHSESLEHILKNNPHVKVITNTSVGKILTELGVTYFVVEGRDSMDCDGVAIDAYDGEHVEIFGDMGIVQNTGYFINNKLFYPGDAYTEPGKPVPVLALPVAGPWCKFSDAMQYALAVAPEKAFPVHDAVLSDEGITLTHTMAENVLKEHNINFTKLGNDETAEF